MFWHFISWGLGTPREVLFKDWWGFAEQTFCHLSQDPRESLANWSGPWHAVSQHQDFCHRDIMSKTSLGLKSWAVIRKWTIMAWKSRLDGARRPEHEYQKDYFLKVLPLSILWMRFHIILKVTTAKQKSFPRSKYRLSECSKVALVLWWGFAIVKNSLHFKIIWRQEKAVWLRMLFKLARTSQRSTIWRLRIGCICRLRFLD